MVAGSKNNVIWGLGRRKTSVARVRLLPGNGSITINRRGFDDFVKGERNKKLFMTPFEVSESAGRFDVHINVKGGGTAGQVGACMLGISRALIKADPGTEVNLRKHGLLTRDSRMVERKKYGLRKARRGCQFSKR
ncbi:MAG TPA: 30S ribosomal protein S9 [Planctomycetota bacterium]|nr:30S ribosomal protein S9 [Planctomycetota bacterium]